MRGEYLVSHLASNPLAIAPEFLPRIVAMATRVRSGEAAPDGLLEQIRADNRARAGRRVASRPVVGNVAIVPMYGLMTQRSLVDISGGGTCSTMQVQAAIEQAVADDAVASIMLDIDSPGGETFGVEELAGAVAAAARRKPVAAVANSMACSAAYWVGSQASEFYCAPGGVAGSIGVYCVHEDISRALEAAGITPTIIKAGRFKAEANSFQPLNDEDHAAIQAMVDAYYSRFVAAVASGRRTSQRAVREGFGQGRSLIAEQAVAAGLADGIATAGEVIGKLQARGRGVAQRARAISAASAPVSLEARRRDAWLEEQLRQLARDTIE